MKKIIVAYIFTFSLLSCETQEMADFAIQNVTVIDVVDEVSKSGVTVLITGTRISKVDNTHNIKLSEDVKIIDGSDKFLIPGLWNLACSDDCDLLSISIFPPSTLTSCIVTERPNPVPPYTRLYQPSKLLPDQLYLAVGKAEH